MQKMNNIFIYDIQYRIEQNGNIFKLQQKIIYKGQENSKCSVSHIEYNKYFSKKVINHKKSINEAINSKKCICKTINYFLYQFTVTFKFHSSL